MSHTKLMEKSREELLAELDLKDTPAVVYGVGLLREEIFRRDFEEQNALMIRMTGQIRALTNFVAVLTLVVTVATIAQLVRPAP